MKFIFVMTFAFVVGAQRNNNRRNDTMNGMNNTMNDMNDTMYDMDDMNHTMHGEGCGMHGHHGGMKLMSKMFFKKLTKICMDVRFPREMYKQCKHCMKEEAKKSPIVENMLKGKFPEKKELGKFMESVETCKLKAGGINDLEKDLTIDKLLQASMVEKWTGNEQDKQKLKQKMTECFNKAEGNGYEKMINYHKCVTEFLLEECSSKDEDPGLMLILSSKLLTIGDESKCSSVRIPQDVKQIRDRCFEQVSSMNSSNSMNSSSDSMNNRFNSMNNNSNSMNSRHRPIMSSGSSGDSSMRSGSSSNNMMQPMKLFKHFWKDCMMKAVECFLTELKMYDTQKETISVTGMTDYVKKLQGWNGIERERDQVISAITECGKSFEEDSDSSSNSKESKDSNMRHQHSNMMHSHNDEDDYDDRSDMSHESPEDEKMKEMLEDKMKFEGCFTPKFAKICGVNNELANFFYPTLDPEFMAAAFKAFMETGGKEAEEMINMLKEN